MPYHRAVVDAAPAPIIAAKNPAPLVLAGGALTIALALLGVWAAQAAGTNVMGWYADYVIPVGALLVGMIASSGFGVASWFTGCKISGTLLWTVVLMLAGGYFLAQWLQYRLLISNGALEEVGFFAYFDAVTRSFRWVDHGRPGSPFGTLGYLIRAGEILGFVGGGVLIPLGMKKMPYCEPCARYKRTREIAYIPSGIPMQRLDPKKDPSGAAAQLEAEQKALEAANEALKLIFEAARKGEAAAMQTAIDTHGPIQARRAARKLSRAISLKLCYCARCLDASVNASAVIRLRNRSGRASNQFSVRALESHPIDRSIVETFIRR
jgi:hypothetical protein